MDKKQTLLRNIPKVDELLQASDLAEVRVSLSPARFTAVVRAVLQQVRQEILENMRQELPNLAGWAARIKDEARRQNLDHLRPVINATGVILHTNLGRACLSSEIAQKVAEVATSYSTLEYDLEKGARGLRYDHIEPLLQDLTGCEAALVVNNNAAAVLLILSALGQGRNVLVSRGELVEIGGSFRVPEIMEQCGCHLKEVGTTNKTHLRDYERAIDENTCALMKVHTSNFKILGFTESVALEDLVKLGHQKGLPVIEDLGSGCMLPLEKYGILDEPCVLDRVRAGVDLLSFSGDKMLGGPQAGIILGKKAYIDQLKHHPLTRAMRVDKMTLAALEATLRLYLDPEQAKREIPVLQMLSAEPQELKEKAERLCAPLQQAGISAQVEETQNQMGGGSLPTQMLPGYAVAITPVGKSVDQLEEELRRSERPIIGRIYKERYLLDVRTLFENDFSYIVQRVCEGEK